MGALTRRTFLRGMAALPLMAAFPGSLSGRPKIPKDVRTLAREGGSRIHGRRLVAIIPDSTRSGGKFVGEALRGLYEAKSGQVDRIVALVALGTHPPMSASDILKYLEISPAEHKAQMPGLTFCNHEWWKPSSFIEAGRISAKEWGILSGEVMDLARFGRADGISVRFNRTAAEADDIVIIGPVLPHEVVGCSGGLKYCSPGIGDSELTGYTHWLGAALTIPNVIGRIDTPVRRVINHCVGLMTKPRKHLLAFVVSGESLHGAYLGEPEDTYLQAAKLTLKLNIRYTGRQYERVLAVLSPRYKEMWTGGKGSYKLIQIVKPGGMLVIYAPNLTTVSKTWGADIERLGYHCLEYVQSHLDEYIAAGLNPCVLAHLTHVYGPGTYSDGHESPSCVHLATGLDRKMCEKLNLRYIDPASIDVNSWRKDPEAYVEDDAGQRLVLPNAAE